MHDRRRPELDLLDEKDDNIGEDEKELLLLDPSLSDTATTDTSETPETSSRGITMDDYFFKEYVRGCRNVVEDTSYLEIFNYSVRMGLRKSTYRIGTLNLPIGL